jgi:xanthine/uracil permease
MALGGPASANDYYANGKFHKYLDLSIGFLGAAFIWRCLFDPFWYLAPILICLSSGMALRRKVGRRYIPIGALSLFALPFMIWWSAILFGMGIHEE